MSECFAAHPSHLTGNIFSSLIVYFLRSAAAAQKLERAGFANVACLTSGLQTVKPGFGSNFSFLI